MENLNLNNLSSTVREQLPFYLANDSEYDNFVKFLELYYEWLAKDGNPIDILTELDNYGDLDKTLDTFVDEFKFEIASVFPAITRVKDDVTHVAEIRSLFNALGAVETDKVKFYTDTFTGNGIISEFLMSYNPPIFYYGKDLATTVTDIKVYSNPANPFDTESNLTTLRNGSPIAGLSFPSDYTLLTENVDFQFDGTKLRFINGSNILTAPTDAVSIKVVYQVHVEGAVNPAAAASMAKKANFTNKKHFYKLLKDFYQSKGSKKSYKFLFRAFFNEAIEIYYPKEQVLKANDNVWSQSTSVRIPRPSAALGACTHVIGNSSNASAVVEQTYDGIQDGAMYTELVVTNIVGTFQSRENVSIHMTDTIGTEVYNRIVVAELYDCVTGFDIVSAGTNYPRNVFLQNYESSGGSGNGFKARIDGTSAGEITEVEVVDGGTNYITGELIEFQSQGMGGSGALARVSKVAASEQEFDIWWVQDPTDAAYPKNYFDISDASAVYSNTLSKNTEVYIQNRDLKYDSVVALFDFDEVVAGSLEFVEYKNNLSNTRVNALRQNPVFGGADIPAKIGSFSLKLDANGYLEIPTLPSLIYNESSFTVDFYYFVDDSQGFGQAGDTGIGGAVFSIYDPASNRDEFVLHHKANGEYSVTINNAAPVSSGKQLIGTVGEWRHVAIHISKSTGAKIYLDGKLETTVSANMSSSFSSGCTFVIGADRDLVSSVTVSDDYIDAFYSSFRVSKGQRFDEYIDSSSDTRVWYSDLDPIPRLVKLEDWQYVIANNRVSLREFDSNGLIGIRTLADWFSLNLKFKNLPIGAISNVEVITGGSGYIRHPAAFVTPVSESYTSVGVGASFTVKSADIGGINKIKIVQTSTNPTAHGFGIGYSTAPTLDLSTLGGGDAVVTAITGPICMREGRYESQKGFVSNDNRIHDGYLWQDYSYVVRVNRVVNEWRDVIKKVVHPLGMAMFGELVILTKVEGKQLRSSILSIYYEIIKNLDLKVKNMDGLGVWTGATYQGGNVVTPVNATEVLSQGYSIPYKNRQADTGSLLGVSDDTSAGANVDVGEGRYNLSKADGGTPANWSEVGQVWVNNKDNDYRDYKFFYGALIVGKEFVIYDTSDKFITDAEHTTTRPYGRYRITDIINSASTTRFNVTHVASASDLPGLTPNDTVEFRWDKVSTGNVEKSLTSWVGSIRDGANPRDEKYIIKIGARKARRDSEGNIVTDGVVPSLGTTFESLERFKFFFTNAYQFQDLVRYRMSPRAEVSASPYNQWYAPNGDFNQIKMLPSTTKFMTIKNPAGTNEYGVVPAYLDADGDGFVAISDGQDHDWGTTTIGRIMRNYDRNYHAVLDSKIIVSPKILVITEEGKTGNGQTRMGQTFRSLERMKFYHTPDSQDNDLYTYKLETVQEYNVMTSIAHESAMLKYMKSGVAATGGVSAFPSTINDLNALAEN